MKSWLCLWPALAILGCTPKADVAGTYLETIAFPSGKEIVKGVLCRPSEPGTFPAIIVVHGSYGLTEWVKNQAKRLATKGYVTLAVDLYRGEVVTDLMDAHIMERGLPEDRVFSDLKSAVDYLEERSDVRRDAIGIMGWDMGGGYALDTAIRDPRLRAAVTCYGRLTTDPNDLATLKAPVLGIFAGKDEGIPRETIDRFRSAMLRAGKRVAAIHIYPTCEHGFMAPSNAPGADESAENSVADAWRRIEAFFAAELGK
jgi:carboxymethylenebutenolidase